MGLFYYFVKKRMNIYQNSFHGMMNPTGESMEIMDGRKIIFRNLKIELGGHEFVGFGEIE